MNTETKSPKTLADYDSTLSDLRRRLEQNQTEAGLIPARRGELALAAAEGDATAFEKMRALDAEEQTLAIEAKNINAAIERAEELKIPLIEEARRRDLKARRTKARGDVDRFIEASAAVDAAIVVLRDALEARSKVAAELYAYRWSHDQQTARDWEQVVYSQTELNTPNFFIHAASSLGLQPYLPSIIPGIAESDRMTLAERAKQGLQLPADRSDYEDV